MKLEPQTEQEFKEIATPEGMRLRINKFVDSNETIKAVMARADVNKLSDLDRYTILAFHALVLLERKEGK